MSRRRKLTEGEPSARNNHGLDTAERDLVLYEGDILTNSAQFRRCETGWGLTRLAAVAVLCLLHAVHNHTHDITACALPESLHTRPMM
jgi:hypothetical protein